MKRITAKALTLIVCALATLVGCGGNPSSPASNPTQPAPRVVRMNIASEPDSLHPWKSAASDTEAIFHNVFEGLVSYDETGKLLPALAAGWEISPDALTYTFSLRQGVTFHNGAPFTAEDAVDSLTALSGLGGEAAISSKFGDLVEKIIAPDDHTLVVTLKQPSAAFLTFCTVPMLPRNYTEQESHPVGTGPFVFTEYLPGQRVVLSKNEQYYDPARAAKIDRAEVYIMSDSAAVVSALRSGQLDIASVMADDAKVLEKDFTILEAPQNMVQIFAFNTAEKPFDDLRVRQAIAFAVNKQDVIAGAFDGAATELYSNFSPIMAEYYHDGLTDIYTQDLTKAKALLAEAGYPDGFTMTITVPANYQQHIDTAQIFAQQLSQLGITVTIEPIEWASWLEDVYTRADYQSTIIGFTGKLNPNDILMRYQSGYKRNFTHFSNAEFDALMAAAAVEPDQQKRIEQYRRCQELLTREAPAVFVCDPHLTVACRRDLVGFTFYPVTFLDFSRLSYLA